MVYMVSPSWYIPYAMKPWFSYANEGFDGGINTNRNIGVFDYQHLGKYYNDGGGQGGIENVPWDGGK